LAASRPLRSAGDDLLAWIKFTSNEELDELEELYSAGGPATERDKARVLAIEAMATARLIDHLEGPRSSAAGASE
jgi:hypothetical protein